MPGFPKQKQKRRREAGGSRKAKEHSWEEGRRERWADGRAHTEPVCWLMSKTVKVWRCSRDAGVG